MYVYIHGTILGLPQYPGILSTYLPTHYGLRLLRTSQDRLWQYQICMTMHADGDIEIAKNRLPSVLKSFHMNLIDVPQDGDCLFTSVGLFLQ